MDEFTLTKQQVVDLVRVYEHFRTYKDFSVTISESGSISVKLDSKQLEATIDKSFVATY